MRCKIIAFVLAAVLLLRGGMLVSQATGKDASVALSLEGECDEDVIKVTLCLSSDKGICGLLASLYYDGESVALTSCGIGEHAESLTLTYNDNEGEVDFLLDGYENCAPLGVLVSFYFVVKDAKTERFNFWLELADGFSAAFISGGDIVSVMPDVSECAVTVTRAASPQKDPTSTLVGIYAKREGDKTKIMLTGRSEPSFLALGFKLFAVDTGTARTQTVFVAAVTHGGIIDFCAELDGVGDTLCVIVTPLIYRGREVREGQKSIFVFW